MRNINARECATLGSTAIKMDFIIYALSKVPQIMRLLNVQPRLYAIGGSVAGLMYGADINRHPHDIDVIVPEDMFDSIKASVIHYDSVFKIEEETSSSPLGVSERGQRHFAFSSVGGKVIDIIACQTKKFNPIYRQFRIGSVETVVSIMDLEHLILAKRNYKRPKDSADLSKLLEVYKQLSGKEFDEVEGHDEIVTNGSGTVLSDLEVLAQLKAKMEAEQ